MPSIKIDFVEKYLFLKQTFYLSISLEISSKEW